MLSANDVRNITFSKQVNGYRREEVDVFLDKVEADYETYERMIKELNSKVHELEGKIEDSKNSESSLQSVLLSAQKLADSIVSEAKEKSGKIVEEAKASLDGFKSREKELSDAFERKAALRKQAMREELDKIIDAAKENRDVISEATEKTVKKQAELYNRLKLETAAFKAEIMDKYKKHLELLSKIPDKIPVTPEEIAAAVDLDVENLSDREKFLSSFEKPAVKEEKEPPLEISEEEETSKPANEPEEAPAKPASTGFVVNASFEPEEEDDEEDI